MKVYFVTGKADPGGAGGKMDEDQLKILDEVPSSAVEMQVKDKVDQALTFGLPPQLFHSLAFANVALNLLYDF